MNRRHFLSAIAASPALRAAAVRRPNVVLMVADDMGWGDVSMNGCPDIRTPHIDSIARDGVRLPQFYANAPECTPTRCALLTGRYQQRVGGLECAIGVNNIGRYDEAEWLQKRGELGLPASEITLPRILKQAGYDTAITGKWHLGYLEKFRPVHHGFDYSWIMLGGGADYFTHMEPNEGTGNSHLYENGEKINPKGYLTNLIAASAVKWLKGRSRAKPFFLYVPFTAPHTPIQNPAEYDAATGTAPVRQGDRPTFAAMVRSLDEQVGLILRQLRDMGAEQDTLVIFHSDNGGDANGRNQPFRGRKSSVFEGGIRVPCAIRWPAKIKSGQVAEALAMTMDLAPTILHAAGVTPPSEYRSDGLNLLPVLNGAPAPKRIVFWRYKRAAARRKAVRDGNWKYINDSGEEYLFNISSDPQEKTNLFARDATRAEALREQLQRWEITIQADRLRNFPG